MEVAGAGTKPSYTVATVFGPFHRRDRSDGARILGGVLKSGELGGRPPHGSDVPAVKAYRGELPDGAKGFEFFTPVQPDRPFGTVMYWRRHGAKGAAGNDEEVKIKVLVARVDQEIEWPL